MKINFINPFGTSNYDQLIQETLQSYARPDTELVITHLKNSPANIDFYLPKHLAEKEIFEAVIQSEKDGFDAVIVGCCYDPGVRVARELVDIPVVGPLEASLQMASYYGHSTAIVTDHYKAVPYLKDLVHVYGYDYSCNSVDSINWFITEMIQSPLDTAKDAYKKVREVAEKTGAESAILGCTIISACLEYAILQGHTEYLDFPILNPNTQALKVAESLADLYKIGRYKINRKGYYSQLQKHNPDEYKNVLEHLYTAVK